jgi:NAD(P)H-hydrate epimerase
VLPPTGGPARALTRAEVREVDRRAIEDHGLPGVVLMENAGRGLAEVVLAELSRRGAPSRGAVVPIVCGRGNNGGDGFVLARHLRLAGHEPRVILAAALLDMPRAGDAGINLAVLERAGEPILEAPDGAALAALLARFADAPLIADALFGTGLATPLHARALDLVRALDAARPPKLGVDLPSGLDCDTGAPLGAAVRCARTVTFVAEKVGFALARELTGPVDVVSIGCPAACWAHVTA